MSTMENKKTRLLRFVWGLVPWILVALLGILIVSLGGRIQDEQVRLAEARKAAMNQQAPAIRVITLTLNPGRLEDKISLPAEVTPMEDLWVKTEVPGQVTALSAAEGTLVKKGQLLVQLDDRDYRARVERVQANYRLAQLDHERIATLAGQKIVARNQLDEIEARLKDLSAQLEETRLALSRTRIDAPIAGRLNEMKAKQGDFLTANEPIAQLLQLETVKVKVGVPESDVSAVSRPPGGGRADRSARQAPRHGQENLPLP